MNDIKISNFFSFYSKFLSSIVQAHAVGLKSGMNNINDHSSLIKGKYDGVFFPVVFKQKYGKKLADVLGTGWPSLYLISDRMKSILESNHLTGWKIFPIKIYDKKNDEISGYYGFSIIGRCGPVDYKKSKIIEKQMVPTGPVYKVYKGFFIGLDQWDGTDFFTPGEAYNIILTQKAADVLKKNKITNMQLENLSEYEMDVDSVINPS